MSQITQAAVANAHAVFHSPHYLRHNMRRQEHLASLGLDLYGKSVLELGAGIGDHTTFFLDRGCTVVAVEPRAENCALFHSIMGSYSAAKPGSPQRVTMVRSDVESFDQFIKDQFEIVYCYGLLYHVADPDKALVTMAKACKGLFLLETCVSYGSHEAINQVVEPSSPSQAFHDAGCRPTRPWLFNKMKSLFPHVYTPRTQPAHEQFPLDWTKQPAGNEFTRAVFIGSREPINNPLLADHLPERQTLA